MTSLRLPKLRLPNALALVAVTLIAACGVPDYKVPVGVDAGNVISPGSGGASNVGGGTSTTGTASTAGAGVGGSTSNKGTGGTPPGTGGAPQLLNDCSGPENCSSFAATKKCNTGLRRCVECVTSADCGAGLYCDPVDFSCHVGCDATDDCGSVACDASKCPALTCDLTTHQCTGCTADADCRAGTICDPVTKACVPGCTDTAKSTDCPTGWLCCGDTCANPLSDVAHCANCVTSCAKANTNMECVNGTCDIASCKDNYADCNSDWHDGCEANKLTDSANCGGCGKPCGTGQACIGGQCGAASCADPNYRNCNNDPAGACTTNILYDAQNCGGCGTACSTTNATPSCDNGNCLLTCKSGFADCNAKAVDGCEVDLSSTAAHCGSCTNTCTNAHGANSCSSGQCSPTCLTGFGDCDGDKSNGCEANETSDPLHCGGCSPCNLPNATAACTGGACTIASCTSTTVADCDGIASNGCEVNLLTSSNHCGKCATACDSTNGTATCSAGACGITCATGFANCDGNVTNGCEVDLTKSVDHCGNCTTVCADQPNGTAVCKSGVCGVSNCTPPFGDCDGLPTNGCEVNENTDPNNCGGCGNKCVIPHATAKCTAGVCGIGTCDAGWADCNGSPADGCEVNLMTDVGNCHDCGSVCAPANAVGACVAGACTITSCKGNFQNCDGQSSNGCEADVTTSVANCGACGAACNNAHGTPSCSAGVCNITCASGWGNCDGNASTGCETPTTSDTANCGTCGNSCVVANGTAACVSSTCTVSGCTSGFSDCDGKYSTGCEVNLNTNLSNCGGCGNACSSVNGAPTCTGGSCGITCANGYGNCDGLIATGCEATLATSLPNCGACGQVCGPANATGACVSGGCSISSCNTGFANCNALVTDGCETNLTSDANNCNACKNVCSFAHASAGCTSGACTLGTCTTGYANCDGLAPNGCEINMTNDVAHCGSCSTVCAYTNASATCTNSTCVMGACNSGFANCNGTASDGCEVNLNSDVKNCGACNNVCPTTLGTPACTNGTCGYSTCATGYATCPTGGTCATNTTNDVNNCGGCGTTCTYANAGASCVSSTCTMGSCTSGYANCDNLAPNGCEVNLKTDVANCNACNTKCTFANASATCVNGACTMGACSSGYANCDGIATNGCESSLATDANNCGTCGHVCPAGCTNGVCNTPCTGICASATTFTVDGGGKCTFGTNPQGSCNSGPVGGGAVCYQTTGPLTGGGCSNFVSGRTLAVNGVAETCDGSWISPLPAARYGGYCINIGAGAQTYASFYIW